MITRKQNIDFGIALSLILLVVAVIFHVQVLYKITIVTLFVTALIPKLYYPLSWVWYKFAKYIEAFFSTVILSVVFCIVVVPVALLRRLFAKDTLYIRDFKKSKESIFITKNKEYEKDDLENQF